MGLTSDLNVLSQKAIKVIDSLKRTIKIGHLSFKLPLAGEGFNVFPRDLLTSSFMLRDESLLRETLEFCVATQGKKKDPYTGEEVGKILHELGATEKRGLSPMYNACDTTALFLLGVALLDDDKFVAANLEAINEALDYIFRHISDDYLFYDDPSFSEAKDYALRTTYWKDTEGIPLMLKEKAPHSEELKKVDEELIFDDGELDDYWRRTENLPTQRTISYPVTYTLVQAQVAYSLKAASSLSGISYSSSKLISTAERMVSAIFHRLWSYGINYPKIAIDKLGDYEGVSSDGLHMLWYLRGFKIGEERINYIYSNAAKLETPYGYRSYDPSGASYSPYSYHWGAIWPHEQFFILEAALHYGRVDIAKKSLLIVNAFKELQSLAECFHYDGKLIKPAGKKVQLWSAATVIALRNKSNEINMEGIVD